MLGVGLGSMGRMRQMGPMRLVPGTWDVDVGFCGALVSGTGTGGGGRGMQGR